jgi:cephalosporin-C deacetylase-like acetyl esterase
MMAYHDAAVLVSLFTGDLYMEAGNADTVQDPAAVVAAYNNATAASSKQIHFFPSCGHSGPPVWAKEKWEEKVLHHRELFLKDALK